MPVVKFFNRASDALDRIMCILTFVSLSLLTIIITAQIISRVFFTALHWSEELSRYLLVFTSFAGASLAYKRGNHIAVTFFINKTKGVYKKVLCLAIYAACFFFFIISTRYSIQLIIRQIHQVSPAMGIPMKVIYLSMPLSFGIMAIHAISGFLCSLGGMNE